MRKKDCHGCIYCEKIPGKRFYQCTVEWKPIQLSHIEMCGWWKRFRRIFGKDIKKKKVKTFRVI